jgi:hypothetical protein
VGVDAANDRRTSPGAPPCHYSTCGTIGYGRRVSIEIRFGPKLTKSTFNGFSQNPPWVNFEFELPLSVRRFEFQTANQPSPKTLMSES